MGSHSSQGLSAEPLMANDFEMMAKIGLWNSTDRAYPRERCIHQLFEEQSTQTPDAAAVQFQNHTLTYSQLNLKSNQLAHWLRDHRVGPDVPVGLCMDRSLEMMVAILGILKAGGAYVPLDPLYPAERLRFMAQDAEVQLIVADADFQHLFPAVARRIDPADRAILDTYPTDNPVSINSPDNLAYIVFTSGSTGTPKGVAVPHRGVVRLVFGQEYMEFGPELTMLQLAPVSFDASTLELWGPLLHGGKCILYPGRVPELDRLEQLLHSRHISAIFLTTSLFNLVIDTRPQMLGGVRTIMTGGEVMSIFHMRKALDLLPNVSLVNVYGPTESTTFTTFYPIPRPLPERLTSVPIGRPIANTQVYVLDSYRQAVPIGVPGELYIGGDGLAREYVNRPELTAERFIRNPFSDDPSSRLYKTGDICRWLEDGTIEYIGRADDQVKIRGFRIELGEIENVLRNHPQVGQAVVMAREDVPGQKYLAAYVTPKRKEAIDTEDLRNYLSEKLPEYMVPHAIMELEQIPLTASGKADRRSLPRPTPGFRRHPQGTEPRTPTEKEAAEDWKELLGIEGLNREDHFFRLGGHSLKAVQAIYRFQDKYHIQMPVSTLFENPTLEGFSAAIDALRSDEQNRTISIPRVSREGPIPQSFAQQRLWIIERMFQGGPVYHISFLIDLEGYLNIDALEKSLNVILNRHEAFRTTFGFSGNQAVQRIGPIPIWSLPITDISIPAGGTAEEEFHRLAAEKARRRFHLETGPLYTFELLKADSHRFALLLNMHHLITDGWSMGVLTEELTELYRGFSEGKEIILAPLPIHAADYGSWQREQIDTLASRSMAYWKEKLAGIRTLTLPEDHPRPPMQTFAGRWEIHRIEPALYRRLTEISRQRNATLNMTMMAVFKILLYRYTGAEDIVIGSPISGRTHRDIERSVGFYVNTVVLRTLIEGDASFLEVLDRVKLTCIEAQSHQDMPFDVVVERLNPPRDPRYSVFFQILFAYQDARYWTTAFPGMKTRTTEIGTGTSKFDLTLFVEESSDGLSLRAEYNTDLYESSSIQRFLKAYEHLMVSVTDNPRQKISDLPATSESRDAIETTNPEAARTDWITPQDRPRPPKPERDVLARIGENSWVHEKPLTETEKQLSEIWIQLFGLERVSREDHFFRMGGHSLLAARMFYEYQEATGIHLPLGLIFQAPTLGQLAEAIDTTTRDRMTKDLVLIKEGDRNRPIFYLPGIGGHTLSFYHLAEAMRIEYPQYGLNLPGLDARTEPLESIEEIAKHFIDLIQTVQPHGPYNLCGYSFGGRVAFEMALQLQGRGEKIGFLGLLGATAPGYPPTSENRRKRIAYRTRDFWMIGPKRQWRYLRFKMARGISRIQSGLWNRLTGRKKRMQGYLSYQERVVEAAMKAWYRYVPAGRFQGNVTVFREGMTFSDLYARYNDPQYGWATYVDGTIDCIPMDCSHLDLFKKPNVTILGEKVEQCLRDSLET